MSKAREGRSIQALLEPQMKRKVLIMLAERGVSVQHWIQAYAEKEVGEWEATRGAPPKRRPK